MPDSIMVVQQILVLSVLVRIQVGQLGKAMQKCVAFLFQKTFTGDKYQTECPVCDIPGFSEEYDITTFPVYINTG